MDKGLLKLIGQRYWKFLALIAVLVIGAYVIEGSNSVKYWEYENNYLQTKEAEDDFVENYASADPEQEHYEYYNRVTKKYEKTTNFEVYRQDRLTYFNEADIYYGLNTYGSKFYQENTFYYFVIAAAVGFLLFFFDMKSHFNTLLFSSQYSRPKIYWSKYLVVGGSLLLSVLLGKLYVLLTIKSGIPPEHFNGEMSLLVVSVLAGTSVIGLVFLISSFAGLILGEWVTGVLTLVGFYVSLSFFLEAIAELEEVFKYYVLGYALTDDYSIMLPERLVVNGLSTIAVPTWSFLVYLLIALVLLISGQRLFAKVTLENNNKYLVFANLRRPTLIVFMLYSTILAAGYGSSYHLYAEHEVFNFWGWLLKIALVAIVSYLIGSLTIYRQLKIGRKRIFSIK
ncbi:hypothetical protein [Vagococcus salmoninarum]|uniref:hypothetical protein n=1 Tax=Vagococcus salmoninarum TaxID=2739 RepID=UPI0028D55D51|nr:hypothetical protein [Vagococcus salmoninarum]